jgi:L-asparaginase / beta-aspartyl-peptidase
VGAGAARVIVHGGIDMEASAETYEVLERAACAGLAAMAGGGPVAAAAAAVSVLEADLRFNAGLGSVLNANGDVECDAGVVDGASGRFAGVAALRDTLTPVQVAAALLREHRQVLLVGEGATAYARGLGFPATDLRTDEQVELWRRYQAAPTGQSPFTGRLPTETVGAIAISADGDVAAASSTGGLLGKRPGRVGDSAVVGAGLFADRGAAALCSGVGEAAVELMLARWATERLRTAGEPACAAEDAVVLAARERGAAMAVLTYDVDTGEVAAAHAAEAFPVVSRSGSATERVGARRIGEAVR